MNDKKNAIKSLQTTLRGIKYLDSNLNLKELNDGSPKEHLKVYHYLFLSYSPALASEILEKHNLELNHKSDKFFIDGVYKLVRDMLDYVPKLTKDQFFQTSFATQKCQMTIDLIRLVQQKCKAYQSNDKFYVNSSVSNPITSSSSTILPLKQITGSNNSATSSSSSSISSYGTSNNIIEQNEPKAAVQIKNHLAVPSIVAPPAPTSSASITTSARLGANLRSTKSFNSKSLTRGRLETNITGTNLSSPIIPHSKDIQQHQQCSSFFTNIEQNLNSLANAVNHLTTVMGSMENRFLKIENSIAKLTEVPAPTNVSPKPISTFINSSEQLTSSINEKSIIKKLDNLTAKVTLIETDMLVLKQGLRNCTSSINNNSSNFADDTASYEIFHSFTNGHSDTLNESSNNGPASIGSNNLMNLDQFMNGNANKNKLLPISQGILENVVVDQNGLTNCNDLENFGSTDNGEINESIVSNDSTPKFIGKSTSFVPKFTTLSENTDILRAKELVLKATRLNNQVKI